MMESKSIEQMNRLVYGRDRDFRHERVEQEMQMTMEKTLNIDSLTKRFKPLNISKWLFSLGTLEFFFVKRNRKQLLSTVYT